MVAGESDTTATENQSRSISIADSHDPELSYELRWTPGDTDGQLVIVPIGRDGPIRPAVLLLNQQESAHLVTALCVAQGEVWG